MHTDSPVFEGISKCQKQDLSKTCMDSPHSMGSEESDDLCQHSILNEK